MLRKPPAKTKTTSGGTMNFWMNVEPDDIRRRTSGGAGSSGMAKSLIHRAEEVGVGLAGLQLVDEEFHGVDHAHGHEDAAQDPHLRERGLVDQQLFLAGAG